MDIFSLKYQPYGESAILIEWPNKIDKTLLNDIRLFADEIKKRKIVGLIDFNFVYNSMLINFDNQIITCDSLILLLKEIYSNKKLTENFKTQTWYIPVCYDSEFGLDLEDLLSAKKIDKEKLISLHTTPFYKVFGIGFLPGFLYLGGLSDELIMPRKEHPRLNIQKGSVGIGSNQTGIYPQNSPGGWHIIGKTPVPLFNAKHNNPCFVSVGDKIKFYSISKPEYEVLEIEVKAEIYDFKRIIND